MRSETQERCAFLYKSSNYYLALYPVRNGLFCFRVDYFNINIIVPVVHTVIFRTADTYTGSVYFGKTVNIVYFNAKLSFYVVTHLIAPTLRAENTLLKINLITHIAFVYLLGKK